MIDEDEWDLLSKTHTIVKNYNGFSIKLTKPQDFIYDVRDIFIEYCENTGHFTINSTDIPDYIKKNMLEFSNRKLSDFVEILEDNLNIFLSGRIPNISSNAQKRPFELPKYYKFNFNNIDNPNLKFESNKRGIFVFICSSIEISVECDKCKEISTISRSSNCPKCKNEIGMTHIPIFNVDYLGLLILKKCKFICLEPSKYQFDCEKCNSKYESDKVAVGQSFNMKCYECFSPLHFKIERVDYIQKKDIKITPGTELPDKGTCKHYKKSFRWFRFSCCKSLYPCDICHDLESNHIQSEAHTMVCGFCSKEQSVKSECDCGMTLKRKHTKFWEGGKGNRDKAIMSRKDNKKYSK